MSNHKTWTWDHRESKSLDLKFLPLGHHVDGWFRQFLNMAYHGSQYASITQIPFFPFVHQHAYIINLRGENYISSKKTRLETSKLC
jgi:hypothetical protein